MKMQNSILGVVKIHRAKISRLLITNNLRYLGASSSKKSASEKNYKRSNTTGFAVLYLI